jgi:hypothetical protein
MADLSALAATLLANLVTIRIPLYEPRWATPRPEQPIEAYYRSRAHTLGAEYLIARSYRQYLQILLLEDGHRAFLDFIESDGLDEWRLHFFCIDASAVTVLKKAKIGEVGEGDPVRFDPQQFVHIRLRQLLRADLLDQTDQWWSFFNWFTCQNEIL